MIPEVRSCVKVEVAVLGSHPIKPMASVHVKQHSTNLPTLRQPTTLTLIHNWINLISPPQPSLPFCVCVCVCVCVCCFISQSLYWSASGLIVLELCESQGGRPGLSVRMSLLVSVDVKLYWTMLRHWSRLVPSMSTEDIKQHYLPVCKWTKYISPPIPPPCFSYFLSRTRLFYRLSLIGSLASEDIKQNGLNEFLLIRAQERVKVKVAIPAGFHP